MPSTKDSNLVMGLADMLYRGSDGVHWVKDDEFSVELDVVLPHFNYRFNTFQKNMQLANFAQVGRERKNTLIRTYKHKGKGVFTPATVGRVANGRYDRHGTTFKRTNTAKVIDLPLRDDHADHAGTGDQSHDREDIEEVVEEDVTFACNHHPVAALAHTATFPSVDIKFRVAPSITRMEERNCYAVSSTYSGRSVDGLPPMKHFAGEAEEAVYQSPPIPLPVDVTRWDPFLNREDSPSSFSETSSSPEGSPFRSDEDAPDQFPFKLELQLLDFSIGQGECPSSPSEDCPTGYASDSDCSDPFDINMFLVAT